MDLQVTYWIPRQYAITIGAGALLDAVTGTDVEAATARTLDALREGQAGRTDDTGQLAVAIREHGQYLLCSDDEHQVDSDAAVGFTVEVRR